MNAISKFVISVIAAIASFVAISTTSATAEIITQEPERYAFVVGQSTYSEDGSSFLPLGGACVEAMQFRQQLIAMGWKRENIFPLVASSEAETEASVREAICNLRTDELNRALRRFTIEVSIDNAPTPSMSVIYLSGHGAESGGDQYIFGTDAQVDFDLEIRRAQIADNYRMFDDTGVNITRQVSVLDGIEGKAVFVIIDACRDNPPLDDYIRRARIAHEPLEVDYIRASEDRDFQNILFLFSTRARRQAAGAVHGSTTLFSQELLRLLGDANYQRLSVSGIADEMPSRMALAQAYLDPAERQRPDQFGRIRPLPVYCLWGCPQDAALWSRRERTRIIASSSNNGAASRETPRRYGASFAPAPAVLQLASFDDQEVAPTPAVTPRRQTRTGADLRIDVFYCTDDERAQEREAAALAYAQALRSALPEEAIHAGRSLGTVRLRSLDANANRRQAYRRIDNSIWIDRDDGLELAWAQRISRFGSERLRYYPTRSSTPNYISVFFCEGAEPQRRVNTVFTQVSSQANLGLARHLLQQLQQRLPRTHFQDVIVSSADPGIVASPSQTQVRYFESGQQANAEEIARELQALLNEPVTAERMRLGRGDGVRTPPIELWFSPSALVPPA